MPQIPVDASQGLDRITLEVIQAYLVNTVREMRANLMRSGYTPTLNETVDFACGLITNEGELLAMSEDLPFHIFAVGFHARLATEMYGDNLHPGDVLMTNDPYTSGPHLNDPVLIYPFFVDGERTLLIAVRAHWADVGGKSPGSLVGQAREIYEEGIRIPMVKIYDRGEFNRDLFTTILANVRNPEEREGDFAAMVGTCRTAERRLTELYARYSRDLLRASVNAILERSERAVRTAIAGLPDGEYFYEEYLENSGSDPVPLPVRCKLTIAGEEMVFDFHGSAAQVQGPMNGGPAQGFSGVFTMIKSWLEPETPVNGGAMRPVRVVMPERSFLNARRPAPVAGYSEVSYIVEHTVIGLLAQILPEKIGAPPEASANHTYIGGWDDVKMQHWIFYEYPWGGTPASPLTDGSNAVCSYDLGDIGVVSPVEREELDHPVRLLGHRLRQDSGGPGYRRGGMGTWRAVQILDPRGAVLSLLGESAVIPRLGMHGGYPGALNVFRVMRDGRTFNPGELPSKVAGFPLRQGDVVLMQTRGAGGWGDPLDREIERVEEDVALGYVSLDQARHAYGVVFDGVRVDREATSQLRVRLRAERPTIRIMDEETDEYDDHGCRVCRLSPDMAARIGVADGEVVEYVPQRGAHLKAWARVDANRQGDSSPLGARGRSILQTAGGQRLRVRPLRPSI
jgi:N-methylhydantoinase B